MRDKKSLLICGGWGHQGPDHNGFNEAAPETNFFCSVGDKYFKSQNPKHEPSSMKALNLRVKKSFYMRVGNHNFRQHRAEIQMNL